jgi:hypothetical protein
MRAPFLAISSLASLVHQYSVPMSNPFASFALAAEHVQGSSTRTGSSNEERSATAESPQPSRKRASLAASRAKSTATTTKKPKIADPTPASGGLQEKLRSAGYPEYPLRCIIVGHNPSAQGWCIITRCVTQCVLFALRMLQYAVLSMPAAAAAVSSHSLGQGSLLCKPFKSHVGTALQGWYHRQTAET